MLNYDDLKEEQLKLIDRLYEHDITLVYATMGSGKTVCSLTALSELIADGVLGRVLVVAPLKPAKEVWSGEHELWGHLKGLDVALAIGTPDKRKKAILSSAPIVVINLENLVWFCDEFKGKHNFDGLILDELSKFKDNGAKVVKKMRYRTHDFKWKVGLTGSPVHENYTGLFAQALVLDGGKTYGTNKEKFLRKYFFPTDYECRNWEVREDQRKPLLDAIKPLWYTVPDYTHEIPPVIEKVSRFHMLGNTKKLYDTFKRDSVIEVNGQTIVADNSAVLSGKLEQIPSGFLYDGEFVEDLEDGRRRYHFAGLRQQINKPCLVFYTFEEEKLQIMERLKGDFVTMDTPNAVELWNKGKVNNFLLHPKSASHGLNLAKGGHNIICYSPIWSNDMFKQLVARLWRRGQTEQVVCWIIVCEESIDELKLQRVDDKQEHDRLLNEYLSS